MNLPGCYISRPREKEGKEEAPLASSIVLLLLLSSFSNSTHTLLLACAPGDNFDCHDTTCSALLQESRRRGSRPVWRRAELSRDRSETIGRQRQIARQMFRVANHFTLQHSWAERERERERENRVHRPNDRFEEKKSTTKRKQAKERARGSKLELPEGREG